jgi:hypothetical protein
MPAKCSAPEPRQTRAEYVKLPATPNRAASDVLEERRKEGGRRVVVYKGKGGIEV